MSLLACWGDEDWSICNELLRYAVETQPSLVVDCANAANPHALFPDVEQEQLHQVYVMNAEAIYRFRDALRQVPLWAERLEVKMIIVMPIHILYAYDDEVENQDVLDDCWMIMHEIGKIYPVVVGVKANTIHEGFAKKYCSEE